MNIENLDLIVAIALGVLIAAGASVPCSLTVWKMTQTVIILNPAQLRSRLKTGSLNSLSKLCRLSFRCLTQLTALN